MLPHLNAYKNTEDARRAEHCDFCPQDVALAIQCKGLPPARTGARGGFLLLFPFLPCEVLSKTLPARLLPLT